MEREYTIGGALVLITIFVIMLVVYFTVPGFNEAIKDIADDVFGISAGKEPEKRANEAIATKIFEDLYRCITTVNQKVGEKKSICSCYLESRNLPEYHTIVLPVEDEKTGERSLELIIDYTRKKKELAGINLRKAGVTLNDVNLQPDSPIKFEDFPGETPEVYGVYKDGKTYVILTTDAPSSIAETLKKLADCESGKIIAKEKSLDFFESFIGKFKACKEIEKKEVGKPCVCSSVNFDTLKNLLGYKVIALPDGKNIKFILHDSEGNKIAGPIEVKDVTTGPTPFLKWDEAKTLEGKRYITLKMEDQIHKHISIYATPSDTPSCTLDVFEKCKREGKDAYEVMARIKTEKYDKIIEEAVSDIERILDTPKEVDKTKVENFFGNEENLKNLKLLGAAIMATESSAKPDVVSATGCKGLMQFCGPAAKEEGLCSDKKCSYGSHDARGVPGASIPQGIKHFLRKASYFDGYTYQEVFGLAAYNGGQVTIKKAIEKTGIKNPTWKQVKDKLTKEVLKEASPGLYGKWSSTQLKNKIKEIKCYPYIVDQYKKEFESRELFT